MKNNISAEEFVSEINEEINKRKYTLSNDESILKALIKHSDDLVKGYNGRQIFEMLQNIDDQNAKTCKIELNTKEKFLIFYNTGDSFSVEGMKSIMLPNNSPKTGKHYIGNKGLGFRSILNWSNDVEIYSDGKLFCFSEDVMQKHFPNTQLSILTIPEIMLVNDKHDYITYIKLKNISPTTIKQIIHELQEFNSYLLLFLNNLQSIEIMIDDEIYHYNCSLKTSIKKSKNVLKRSLTTPEYKQEWWIYNKNYKMGDEICNIQIAINQEQTNYQPFQLFNYFPTRHIIELPCILHATLELEDTRKYIRDNNSKNNKIINELIPECFKDFADFIKKYNTKDCWLAYKLLSPPAKDNDELINTLYTKILEIRDNGKYCPCIDNVFRNINDVFYYGEDISRYFNFNKKVWNVILPEIVKINAPSNFDANYYSSKSLVTKINKYVKSTNLTDKELVKLIRILYEIRKKEISCYNFELKEYKILRDNKNRFISQNNNALTPQVKESIKLPKYMKYSYLSNDFYKLFINEFDNEIDNFIRSGAGNPKRSFINKLKSNEFNMLNITFYDKHDLVPQIIKDANVIVSDDEIPISKKNEVISQMLHSLYDVAKQSDDLSVYINDKIPLQVNIDNTILYTFDYLSHEAKSFYDNFLAENVYLPDYSFWGFSKNENIETLKSFFNSLGVQNYIRIKNKSIKSDDEYFKFIQTNNKFIKEGHYDFKDNLVVKYLPDASVIKRIKTELFLKLLKEKVDNDDSTLKDLILKQYTLNWLPSRCYTYRPLNCECSYMAFQLANMFDKHIYNLSNETFNKLGYITHRHEIEDEEVMCLLGAKKSIEDFSTNELYSLLQNTYDKKIVPTQSFYKTIFDSLKNRNDNWFVPPPEMMLYAKVGENQYDYRLHTEIYYDDNKSYGKIYLNKDFPILNLQPKLGADKVCDVFGVKRIDDNEIKIEQAEISNINVIFNNELKTYLPYFLAIRINNKKIDNNQKKELAQSLKNTKIILVNDLVYKIKNVSIVLDENSFIYSNGKYYIKTDSKNKINNLHKNIDFCTSIANILSIEMKAVSEEQDYKNCYYSIDLYNDMFQQNSDIKDEVVELLNITVCKSEHQNTINNVNIDDYYEQHKNKMVNIISMYKNSFKHLLWNYLNENPRKQKYYRTLIFEYEDIADSNEINEVCKKYSNQKDCNYKAELLNILKSKHREFSTDLEIDWNQLSSNDFWDAEIMYPEFNNDECFEENSEIYSLLFFKGHYDYLAKQKINNDKKISANKDSFNSEIIYDDLDDEEFDLEKIVNKNPNNQDKKHLTKTKSKGTGKAGMSIPERNKAGEIAEIKVLNYLKKCGKNPIHVSGYSKSPDRSDAYHYDIKYLENGIIKYVEVKSAEISDEFYMSDDEYKFATSHKDDYILAIVKNNRVKLIDDFVDSVNNNEFFTKDVEQWKFRFSLKHN